MRSPKRILFSAHDPGGALAIAPVIALLLERGDSLLGIVSGPAKDIFSDQRVTIVDGDTSDQDTCLDRVVAFSPDVFLAGTSGGKTIDKEILLHLDGSIPSVYVLDFWNNYWQRFSDIKGDWKYLPDVICVPDAIAAEEMQGEGFPMDHIVVTGNPHFAHFADTISTDGEKRDEVIFISQPIQSLSIGTHLAEYTFDEYRVLEDVIDVIKNLRPRTILKIRLHPREEKHKYDTYLEGDMYISQEKELTEAISKAGLVIGMFSPVLLQASVAGKKVISYQPSAISRDSNPIPAHYSSGIVLVGDTDTLVKVMLSYFTGNSDMWPKNRLGALFPLDAAERVIMVIDTVVSR